MSGSLIAFRNTGRLLRLPTYGGNITVFFGKSAILMMFGNYSGGEGSGFGIHAGFPETAAIDYGMPLSDRWFFPEP